MVKWLIHLLDVSRHLSYQHRWELDLGRTLERTYSSIHMQLSAKSPWYSIEVHVVCKPCIGCVALRLKRLSQ